MKSGLLDATTTETSESKPRPAAIDPRYTTPHRVDWRVGVSRPLACDIDMRSASSLKASTILIRRRNHHLSVRSAATWL